MLKALSSILKRTGTKTTVFVAGPIGLTVSALLFAWGFSVVTPAKAQAAGIPCSDGNSFDGDCCSSMNMQEESRFGFVDAGGGVIIPNGQQCNLNGPNACEDGQDNDGDGLIDSADPECGSVGPGTAFAIIGDDPNASRFSVRLGAQSQIRHAKGDGSTVDEAPVSQFWVSGVCNAGQCACPTTAGVPMLDHPSCQVEGRTCTTSADCGAGGYPGNFSNASVCSWQLTTYREAIVEGKVIARGSIDLGRGYLPPRNLLNIGDKLVCNGCGVPYTSASQTPPHTKFQGDPPWVGTGVCFPSGDKSCYSDNDCASAPAQPGDLCEGRKQFAFMGHPLIDFTGGTEVASCAAAMVGMAASADPNNPGGLTPSALPGIPAFDPNNPSFDLDATPPLTSNAIKVLADQTQTLDFEGPGLHVRDIDSITMSGRSTLILRGRSDAIVVLRILGGLRMGTDNSVLLQTNDPPDQGLKVSNVLWLLDGDSGIVQTGHDIIFNGTILAPERETVLIGGDSQVHGSLFAHQVDVKTGTMVLHQPFTGSIGTDLEITKTQAPDPSNPSQGLLPPGVVAAGEDIIYTLNIVNNGPTVATGVVVTDVLPNDPNNPAIDGVTVNSHNATQGACTVVTVPAGPDRVICFIGTLGITQSETITIDVRTKPSVRGVLINTSQIDSSVDENLPADNTSIAATAVVGIADLTISKSDSPDPAIAGQTNGLTYTINVNNLGPSDAIDGGVIVFDAVPANMVVVSANHADGGGGGTTPCQVSSNTVTCQVGDVIVADGNDVITIVVTPACDAHLTNGLGTPLMNSTNVSNPSAEADPVAPNNSANTTTEYVGQVDLTSSKTDSVSGGIGYVVAGESMFYTVNVNNAGPSTASGVEFTDTLPNGTTFSASAGCMSLGGQNIECAYGSDITCLTSSNLQVNVDVAASVANSAVLTNNVTGVTSLNETDTVPGNNTSSTNTTVRRRANLGITKSFVPLGGETDCVPGAQVEYTMVVTNSGPSDSTGGSVTDDFDSNLSCTWTCTAAGNASCLTSMASGTGSGGSGDISQLVDIAAGGGNSLTYVATCTIHGSMRGNLSNTANVAKEAGTLDETDLSDNSDVVSCNLVPRADLSVIKQLMSSPPHVAGVTGDITYQVTVTNLGPSNAIDGSGVVAQDDIPAGTSLVSATPSQGMACTGGATQTCVLGALNAGNSATIDIVLTADCDKRGMITNTARAITSGEADPNTPNTAMNSGVTVVGQINLSLIKTASVETPAFVTANDTFTYTIDVANTGPSDAQNLTVTDTLDADVTVQGPLPAGCSHPGGPGGVITCTIADLACGSGMDQLVFTVEATGTVVIGDLGEIDNTASISSATDLLGTTSANDGAETDLRRDQGVSCTAAGVDADCETNFCVHNGGDDVCCNTACNAPICESCLASKTDSPNGTCDATTNNTDPDMECTEATVGVAGECGQDGLCGGLNDGGSGVDRRRMCGLRASGTGCITANQLGTGGCSLADTCDGLGICQPNDRPEFTVCSGNGANECSNIDTCNNNGTCNNRDVAAATPCTDTALPAAGDCKDAQCNGTGTCDQMFANEANGLACADGDFCNGFDTCQTGACTFHNGNPCQEEDGDADCSESCVDTGYEVGNCDGNDTEFSACTGNGVNECSNADTCTATGVCSNRDVAAATPCTDTSLPMTTGNCKDAQCNGTGTCDQNFANETNGSSCADGDYCNGADQCTAGACTIHAGVLTRCNQADGDSDCSEMCVDTGYEVGNCDGNDPNGSACNDLNGATYADLCNGSGACIGTPHVPPTAGNTIFVSNGAGSTGAGTCGGPTDPCNTIALGLSRAVSTGKEGVCIEIGTFVETVTLITNKNVRGGFLRDGNGNWVPNVGLTNVTGAASGAVVGSSVSGIIVDRLNVSAGAPGSAGESSYGVRLVSSSTITLSNNTITASSGAAGSAGSAGSNGAAGSTGGGGGGGSCDSDIGFNGGGGGGSSCGRPGGGGGEGGFALGGGGTGTNGTISGGGGGPGGGGGGGGNPGGTGNNGGNAIASGGNGGDGVTAGTGGGNSGGVWVTTNGTSGISNGTAGHGGGGGGGGGGQGASVAISGNGNGGGGGGGGGCPGTLGTAGTGGGGSFGIYISGGGAVTMTFNTIASASGGSGGSGGNGGSGGGGAGGGVGGGSCTGEVGRGGNGGSGSGAGRGGHGGAGAGGPTITIFCSGGTQSCAGNMRSNGNAGSGGTSGVGTAVSGLDALSSGCGGGC